MFEHTAVLLSFVYALALTHLLSSVTDLVLARERVRFSGLQAAWMLIALVLVFVNWLEIWGLRAIAHWSLVDVTLLFLTAVTQYFTCSLVSVRVERGESVDMSAVFERQKPAFLAACAAMVGMAMVLNYAKRDHSAGLSATDWIGENLLILPMAACVAISAFARARWLQWASAIAMLASALAALALYTPLG